MKLAKSNRRHVAKAGTKRQPRAIPQDARCIVTVPWGNGETAQCMRRKAHGDMCRQHAKMAK